MGFDRSSQSIFEKGIEVKGFRGRKSGGMARDGDRE